MKKVFTLIFVLLLVGGWSLAASALHLVWTGGSLVVIPKNRLGISDTYVNVSAWTPDDVSAHPLVAKRLVATGKAEVLSPAFSNHTGEELVAEINDATLRAPTSQPAPTIIDKAQAKAQEIAHQAGQVVQH